MIPRFMRVEVWPYASVDVVPMPKPTIEYWVRLRFHKSGHEETYVEKSPINRGILIIVTQNYADVVAQGERVIEPETVHG